MKLLFVTQVLDGGDAVLGFVVRWVQGLAARCERVRVIALEVGDLSALPSNVDVRVLGRKGRLGRYFRYQRFLSEAFEAEGFDTLLSHMVPRYSTAAARSAARHGVGHFLWYTHKGVDARLRKAVTVVDKVFTASPESMRVETPKKVVTGHGIDLEHFAMDGAPPDGPPRLLAVGRLTPAKDPHTLLAALALLVARGRDVHLDLVGGGLAAGDSAFGDEVRARIAEEGLSGRVTLHGAVPYRDVPAAYRRATVFVSTSLTGSVDKVVLEAMAAARPVVTCNESFPPLFAELGEDAARLAFQQGDAAELAQRIEGLLDLDGQERAALGGRLRGIVARDHEVDALMARLVAEMGGGG
ncbi:MAG: glycosyltransferase [Planctomycetota bacterium]|nr:MAG: glycosyltransferase [Planctomycetota bacterium]